MTTAREAEDAPAMTATSEPGRPRPPRRARLLGFALALLIAVCGGLAFAWLTMPLPWLLGAIVFITAAAVLGAPVSAPPGIRPYVIVVIGVMLGSGFSPAILDDLGAWLLSLGLVGAYLVVSALLVVPYYRLVGGFDRVTAYFSGMPGGLTEMMLIGGEMGGDDRKIVLAHTIRIILVVCLIALWFRVISGLDLGDRSAGSVPFAGIPPGELLILAAAGVAGFVAGRALRLPAPTLIGPMVISAALHMTGIVASPPPAELVVAAQVLLGTIIGCRFVGVSARAVGQALVLGLGATAILLAVTFGFAALIHDLVGQTFLQVLLAFSPGGFAEMSLVALAMGADVAYVASHHLARIVLVIAFAPAIFRLLRRIWD